MFEFPIKNRAVLLGFHLVDKSGKFACPMLHYLIGFSLIISFLFIVVGGSG